MQEVEVRSLKDLKQQPDNPRLHPLDQVNALTESMQRYGFTMPLLITDDGQIIAGHGRAQAAASLGLTEVPCIVAYGWSESMVLGYSLADNKLADMSDWSPENLGRELQYLAEFGLQPEQLWLAPDLVESAKEAVSAAMTAHSQSDQQQVSAKPLVPSEANRKPLSEVICPNCFKPFKVGN